MNQPKLFSKNIISSVTTCTLLLISLNSFAQLPSCNGKTATHYITEQNLPSMATRIKSNSYQLQLNRDAVVVIDLAKEPHYPNFRIKLNNGANSLCATGSFQLDLSGALEYLDTDIDNLTYTQQKYFNHNLEIKLKNPATIALGSGKEIQIDTDASIDLTTLKREKILINSRALLGQTSLNTQSENIIVNSLSPSSRTLIETGKGKNVIEANVAGPVIISAGSGEDSIKVSATSPYGRALVIGGGGSDFIRTGDADDVVIRSKQLGKLNTHITADEANVFWLGNMAEILTTFKPDYASDKSLGFVDTQGGNDFIFGTDGQDLIFAQEGDDEIHGFGGNDQIDGGSGNNKICGGDGNSMKCEK